ncbi:MAG: (4Fe-4S)-binding protein [Chloroflexota bacterium]
MDHDSPNGLDSSPEATPADDNRQERKRPGVERIYSNDNIAVSWEPQLCIHFGACFRRLPQAFKPLERPWVDVNAASPEEVAATVMLCPTGALHFERLDAGPQEAAPEETTITERPNGPLFVRGRVRIRRQDESVREDTRVALCRCGQSANKPFCDGTHRRIGFRTVSTEG